MPLPAGVTYPATAPAASSAGRWRALRWRCGGIAQLGQACKPPRARAGQGHPDVLFARAGAPSRP
eukprot:6717293-Alexandrium_andersonii.AAC.1